MKKTTIIIIVIVLAILAGGAYFISGQSGSDGKIGDCALTPWIPACAGMTKGGTNTASKTNPPDPLYPTDAEALADKQEGESQATDAPASALNAVIPAPSVSPEAIAEIANYQYTENYANAAYGFAFKYPKDFSVSELPSDNGQVILAQNTAKNIGAQIFISPFDGEDIDITVEFIKAEIPDLKISEPRAVSVGSGREGLAFTSDNPSFGGKSSEIWFVANGNLYQLSAYASAGGFLNGLFGTMEIRE